MKRQRIIGIDVARALAVIGMVIVNFKIVFGETGNELLKSIGSIFDGKAAATFVVLAGVGLALMTKKALKAQEQAKLRSARKKMAKRALFLFVLGLSYMVVWPADILHFYGFYILVALIFINRSDKQLLLASAFFILLYPLLIILLDYEKGWDFSLLKYTDFWTFNGFVRNTLFNGFHPVIPWVSFMLFGVWFGRQNLYDGTFLKKCLWISIVVFVTVQLVSMGAIYSISGEKQQVIDDLMPLLGTAPMPPMPIYMINGISISVAVISSCILIARQYEDSKIISALNKTGKLALTFYVAHVVLGMGLVEAFGPKPLGEYSIEFSIAYALIFNMLCILFAVIWMRYKKSGPLEWGMRKLTD